MAARTSKAMAAHVKMREADAARKEKAPPRGSFKPAKKGKS